MYVCMYVCMYVHKTIKTSKWIAMKSMLHDDDESIGETENIKIIDIELQWYNKINIKYC